MAALPPDGLLPQFGLSGFGYVFSGVGIMVKGGSWFVDLSFIMGSQLVMKGFWGTVYSRSVLSCRPMRSCTSTSKPEICVWVVVKIMVPFWIPIILRDLIFRVPKKGP